MNAASVRRLRTAALRSLAPALCVTLLLAGPAARPASAAKLGPTLTARLSGLANTAPVGTVIVAFNTNTGLTNSHLLTLAGIVRGTTLPHLGMVAVPATAGQVRSLATNPSVRSLWLNDRLHYLNDQTRTVTGVDKMRLALGEGNTVGLLLTDPNGAVYSSGIALPVLDAPSREVVVKNPVAGQWLLEVRGVRGLAAMPEVSLPTSGAALPGPVDGSITQQVYVLPVVADIQGDPSKAEIEFVLKNRMMDVRSDGLFHPTALVTRGDFAQSLVFNTALRQSLANAPRYLDVPGSLGAIAEASTAAGSTLRDYDFAPTGMLAASGPNFFPDSPVSPGWTLPSPSSRPWASTGLRRLWRAPTSPRPPTGSPWW
jgi:hypothetical protein